MTVTIPGHLRDRHDSPAESATADPPPRRPGASATPPLPLAFVAPRHRGRHDWPWITHLGPMRQFDFRRVFIENTFRPIPRLTEPYRQWQYLHAACSIRSAQLAFLFSTDVGVGMTRPLTGLIPHPLRVYVGFTQDGPWPRRRINTVARALRRCDAVTVFTEEERLVYIDRYRLDSRRVHVIPLHTDETDGYRQYTEDAPRKTPYALSLGSPNRRFMPVARACRTLGIDLVIITRPDHRNDSLDELASLGAEIITDADRLRALTYLKHARLAVAAFDDPNIPGGFTTLVHAMFFKTPCVVTRSLGMIEHVVSGLTGFVTPHDDQPALREAIGQVWNDTHLAERFGRAAFRRARARHSPDAAADMFHRLARTLLHP